MSARKREYDASADVSSKDVGQRDFAEKLRQDLLWFEYAEFFYLCEVAMVERGHLAATL